MHKAPAILSAQRRAAAGAPSASKRAKRNSIAAITCQRGGAVLSTAGTLSGNGAPIDASTYNLGSEDNEVGVNDSSPGEVFMCVLWEGSRLGVALYDDDEGSLAVTSEHCGEADLTWLLSVLKAQVRQPTTVITTASIPDYAKAELMRGAGYNAGCDVSSADAAGQADSGQAPSAPARACTPVIVLKQSMCEWLPWCSGRQ
jgi:hypothetical protein